MDNNARDTTDEAAAGKAGHGTLVPVEVYFDEFDRFGILHNSHYQTLVERAWIKFWTDLGLDNHSLDGDAFNVVKRFEIIFDAPLSRSGPYAVEITVDLGNTSATGDYRICSADGADTYAHGSRTVVRLDRHTFRPIPWSDEVRKLAAGLTVGQ
jgi:acyl-CoA thioester hydrolase